LLLFCAERVGKWNVYVDLWERSFTGYEMYIHTSVKLKFALEQTMKAQRGCRVIALLFL
jgi:hypothetical protein